MGKISQAFSKLVGFFMDIACSIVQQTDNPIMDNQKCPRIPEKKKQITKKQLRKLTKAKLLKKGSHKLQLLCQTSNIQDGSHQNQGQYNAKSMKQDRKICQMDKKSSNINFLSYIKQKQQEILCSICRQTILLPAITECNHIFCLQCIEQSINISKVCPLCRNPLNNTQNYGVFLFNALEDIISKIRKSDDNLQIRLKEHQQWKQKRFIASQYFEQGLKIDIWKIDSKQWKKGSVVIVDRNSKNNEIQSILVNYQNQKNDSDEVIQIPTLRIASHQFYTKKQERGSTILHRVFSRNSFLIDSFSENVQNIFPIRNFLQTRIQNEHNLFSPLLLRRTTFNRIRPNFFRASDTFSIRAAPSQQHSESEFNFFQQEQLNLFHDQPESNEIVNQDSYREENENVEAQSPTQMTGQVQQAENRGNEQEQSQLLNNLNPVQFMFENESEQSQLFPEENDILDSGF